jgi:hypothetical protein
MLFWENRVERTTPFCIQGDHAERRGLLTPTRYPDMATCVLVNMNITTYLFGWWLICPERKVLLDGV